MYNEDIEKPRNSFAYKISNISFLKWVLLFPLVYLIFSMGVSVIRLFSLAFVDDGGFTLQHISRVFSTPVYVSVMFSTVRIAFVVTIISVLAAYPISYLASTSKSKVIRMIIDTIMMMTFCTSILVRNFSLIVILQKNGILNSLLSNLGMTSEPVALVYNEIGVIIGLTTSLIPYVYLSLSAVMKSIDPSLRVVSQSLGARPSYGFTKVFLPLSSKGILGGGVIVFVLALGFYITPTLLGGANSTMMSVLIQENINRTLNWNLAAALSLLMFTVIAILMIIVFSTVGFSIFIPDSGNSKSRKDR